jgi:hypothetical protein
VAGDEQSQYQHADVDLVTGDEQPRPFAEKKQAATAAGKGTKAGAAGGGDDGGGAARADRSRRAGYGAVAPAYTAASTTSTGGSSYPAHSPPLPVG